MRTWVPGAAGSGFDLDHLPYGVFSRAGHSPRVGVRIGDFVLDGAEVAAIGKRAGYPDGPDLDTAWRQPTLNPFLALGPEVWNVARGWLVEVLGDDVHEANTRPHLIPLDEVTLLLPIEVGDYVDFYASEHHATNVGRMFRPDGDALLPNWKHLPVGYHGRAGTVVVSGTEVVRPRGQLGVSSFGPTKRLDIEAELGFVVGAPSDHGNPLTTGDFRDHVFGVTLVNDWSARDIQAWEYQPLGPFLGKSFATSISPWITPLAALDDARVPLPGQDPAPLPYLQVDDPAGYGIDVEVLLNGEVVSRPPYSSMYWSPAQMLAHLTSNGASVRAGDLYASGTISGPVHGQRGSFLELWEGSRFLEDGDEVTLRAFAGAITLGEVGGRIRPTRLT